MTENRVWGVDVLSQQSASFTDTTRTKQAHAKHRLIAL